MHSNSFKRKLGFSFAITISAKTIFYTAVGVFIRHWNKSQFELKKLWFLDGYTLTS